MPALRFYWMAFHHRFGRTGCAARGVGARLRRSAWIASWSRTRAWWTPSVPNSARPRGFPTKRGRISRSPSWRGWAREHHLVISSTGSELLLRNMPGVLRVHWWRRSPRRLGNLMVDRRLERQEAKEQLRHSGIGADARCARSDLDARGARSGKLRPGDECRGAGHRADGWMFWKRR